MQELVIKKLMAGKKVRRVGKAVFKTAAIVLYYIIVGANFLITFIYFEATRDKLMELILCKSVGSQDCDVSTQTTSNVFKVVAPVLQALISVVVLMFSFSSKDCWKIKPKNCFPS